MITLQLTPRQAELLWEMLNKVSIPGAMAEEFVGIKQVVVVALKNGQSQQAAPPPLE